MGFCHTGVVDLTGTKPCVFAECIAGGADGIKKLEGILPAVDSLPETEGDLSNVGLRYFKEEIVPAGTCQWYEDGICIISKLNRFKFCEDLQKAVAVKQATL